MENKTVTISLVEYREYIRCYDILEALNDANVQDWNGYKGAMENINEETED